MGTVAHVPRSGCSGAWFSSAAGASVDVQVRFHGEDLEKDEFINPDGRGWGKRRSGRDYLFAKTDVGFRSYRAGLGNVGTRHSRATLLGSR